MPRSLIIIGNNIYKTQRECENDVKNKIIEIGISKSVKTKSNEIYDFFYSLCEKHPCQIDKLKNIVDFEIKQDALNKRGLALIIINKNGTTTEISWRKCIKGKEDTPQQLYKKALRQVISSQIQTYREKDDTNISLCSLCNVSLIDKMYHIDHEIHFAKLLDDFTKLHNIIIPTEYNKKPITFERIFVDNDEWIGKLFYDYHLNNAKLRVVCEKCNLTREKYKI
jgi:hypothetical protein